MQLHEGVYEGEKKNWREEKRNDGMKKEERERERARETAQSGRSWKDNGADGYVNVSGSRRKACRALFRVLHIPCVASLEKPSACVRKADRCVHDERSAFPVSLPWCKFCVYITQKLLGKRCLARGGTATGTRWIGCTSSRFDCRPTAWKTRLPDSIQPSEIEIPIFIEPPFIEAR